MTKGRISITKAAELIGRDRSFVRNLIETGKLNAMREGGNDRWPWLTVDPNELRAVYQNVCRYVPKNAPKRKMRRPRLEQDPITATW